MTPATPSLAVGSLSIDPRSSVAEIAGRRISLSPAQADLLALLLGNAHRVVTRDELAKAGGLAHRRSVDVALSTLRRALGRDFLRNVRSRGWIVDRAALDG